MSIAFCQTDSSPFFSIFLIGDAGELAVSQVPYKDTLQYQLAHSNIPNAVIFLGDNIYQSGMPSQADANRRKAELILDAQIRLIKNGSDSSHIYFVPGNHDWKQGRKDGYKHILQQQAWFDSLNSTTVTMLPRDGCPGPVEVSLSENITLIILDTQWSLHKHDKPAGEDSPCHAKNKDEIFLQLQDLLQRNQGKRVIVVGHHPAITYGDHGGVYKLRQHIFPLTDVRKSLYIPLPIFGSFYPLYRIFIGDPQDGVHRRYKLFRCSLMKVLEQFPGTIYASGHDHSLQFSEKDNVNYIVSGAGVKTAYVKKKGYAKFACNKTGFVRLNIASNGEVNIDYFSNNATGKAVVLYTKRLELSPSNNTK